MKLICPLIQTYTMQDWVVDCVFTCKGKEYRRTIGVRPVTLSEGEALEAVRNSILTSRRGLQKDHSLARPPITNLEMTPYRRHNHPRFRRDTQDLSVTDLLAKG